ncbi:MAG TPA: flagellar motor switch protein FliN [Tepidisphaeraceae bacterium]|nr:flagellar motor switch protein FliN [Tepidisphaeraceae bacterium]
MAEEQPPIASGEEVNEPSPDQQPAAQPAESVPQASAAPEPSDDAAETAAPEQPVKPTETAAAATDETSSVSDDQKAIDDLLKQATFEDPHAVTQAMPSTSQLDLPSFSQVAQEAQASSIDLLRDVDLNVKIELGRSRMLVEDVLKLGEGSVVELDKLAGDPVDVFVNERLVARGEVLVLNDNFCVRINEIVAGVKEEGL